jgi:hypothetical protein
MKIKGLFLLCFVMIFSITLKAQEAAAPIFPKNVQNDTI